MRWCGLVEMSKTECWYKRKRKVPDYGSSTTSKTHLRVQFLSLQSAKSLQHSINMKCLIPLSLLVASVVAAPTAAPQAEGATFPITDLIDSDLTIDEYAAQLEGQSTADSTLSKRQYNGDTFNQLTDGTA
jgi:hypothetical protein